MVIVWFEVRPDVQQNKASLHESSVSKVDIRHQSYSCKIHHGEATLAVTDGYRKLAFPLTT